jgi:hypothetical protein
MMKISQTDFDAMRLAIEAALPSIPARHEYESRGYSPMRWRWDCLHASKFNTSPLYRYLDDANIETALRRILPDAKATPCNAN